MTRLPGFRYGGHDRDGFMSVPDLIAFFERCAVSSEAPIVTDTAVQSVKRSRNGFRVVTDRGVWLASSVVVATGYCDLPAVPAASRGVAPSVRQVVQGATCVFASVPSGRFRAEIRGDASSAYRRLVREVSTVLAARLDDARQAEPVRGFGGHVGFIKRSTGDGWALVGDAGYFKDPLTAHGITDALRDAELLARAITKGTTAALSDYETTRYDLSRRLFDITDDIASFAWTDGEVQSLHRAFSSEMSREVRALAALEPQVYCRRPARLTSPDNEFPPMN